MARLYVVKVPTLLLLDGGYEKIVTASPRHSAVAY